MRGGGGRGNTSIQRFKRVCVFLLLLPLLAPPCFSPLRFLLVSFVPFALCLLSVLIGCACVHRESVCVGLSQGLVCWQSALLLGFGLCGRRNPGSISKKSRAVVPAAIRCHVYGVWVFGGRGNFPGRSLGE